MAKPAPDMDFERARIALMKALTRLQVAPRVAGQSRRQIQCG